MLDKYARGVDWLIRYGYLPSPDTLTGQLHTREGIEEAVRKMQCFAAIKETGKQDHATLELMARPLCSLRHTVSSEDLLKGKWRDSRHRLDCKNGHWLHTSESQQM